MHRKARANSAPPRLEADGAFFVLGGDRLAVKDAALATIPAAPENAPERRFQVIGEEVVVRPKGLEPSQTEVYHLPRGHVVAARQGGASTIPPRARMQDGLCPPGHKWPGFNR
jgi:hypothetical protein